MAILSYMLRARIPIHTLALRVAIPICDCGSVCGESESVKSLETVPSFSAIKYPWAKVLLASQLFNSELMETEMGQCFLGSLQGKFTSSSLPSFSARIIVSLGYFFVYLSPQSPLHF